MTVRRKTKAALAALALVVTAVAMTAPGAWAGKPEMQRIEVDETFFDEFVSDECGVDVFTHLSGHIILRSFGDRENGVVELTTLNVGATLTSNGNTFRARDVGADQVRLSKDGAILSIIGQVPFGWFGVLKINLETGETVHEPQRTGERQLAAACAALTA